MVLAAREGDAPSLDSEPNQVDSKPDRVESEPLQVDNGPDRADGEPHQTERETPSVGNASLSPGNEPAAVGDESVSVDDESALTGGESHQFAHKADAADDTVEHVACELDQASDVDPSSSHDHDSNVHRVARCGTLLGHGRLVTAPEVAFSMPFGPGQLLLNTYEVLSLIAVGRSTFVVAAVDRGLGRQVALKFLRPEFAADPQVSRRFAHQAKLQCGVRSEHVVRVFQVDEFPDGQPFVVMERLHGIGLRTLLRTHGRVPLDHACEFVLQACEGLATAHRARIVHGEMKPEHLFLAHADAQRERLKLLDLGLCRELLHDDEPEEFPSAMLGLPPARTRERGEGSLDERADIRSLGVTLYELLSGEEATTQPETGAGDAMLLEQLPARLTGEGGMEAVQAVIERCLALEPRQGFRSVADLAQALVPFAPARAHTHAEHCARTLNEQTRADDFDLLAAPEPGGELETLRIALTEPFGPSVAGGTRRSLATLALVAACASAAFIFTYHEVSSRDSDARVRSDVARVSATAVVSPAQALKSQPGPPAPLHQIVIEQLSTDGSEHPASRAAPGDATGARRPAERPIAFPRARNNAEGAQEPTPPRLRSPKRPAPAAELERTRLPGLPASEPDVGF